MPGLVPGIHVFAAIAAARKEVDARDERGHDEQGIVSALTQIPLFRANHSYPVLNGFGRRSYPIIFNLNGPVSYRDRGFGRTVNTSNLS